MAFAFQDFKWKKAPLLNITMSNHCQVLDRAHFQKLQISLATDEDDKAATCTLTVRRRYKLIPKTQTHRHRHTHKKKERRILKLKTENTKTA